MKPSDKRYHQFLSNDICILIVDDEESIVEIVKRKLIREEIFNEENILYANDGRNALKIFEEKKPQLVFTDLRMPEMNGSMMIEKIRSICSETEIIVATGYADLESTVSLFKWNVSDFIQKPFDFDHVISLIDKIKNRILIKCQNEKLKKRIIQNEKYSAIGLLASGIAHEINNPNAFIRGNAEVIGKYLQKICEIIGPQETPNLQSNYSKIIDYIDNMKESIKSISNGSVRIEKITSGLLTYSKKSASMLKGKVHINKVVEDALSLISYRTKKHTLHKNVCKNDVYIEGSAGDLLQLVINLINNAV
ncbi:MAG: response regulator, partial [Oligoflexia bacterium]|nr:response regulator [Oligoflexia bacterium]